MADGRQADRACWLPGDIFTGERVGTTTNNGSQSIHQVLDKQHILSGADGLSSRNSMGVSSLFLTMRAERTVMTFRALPSIVTAKTTRTGGSEENCERQRQDSCTAENL